MAMLRWVGDEYPQSWFLGPLGLFTSSTQSFTDRIIGGLVAAALTPLILARFIKPGRISTTLSMVGIFAWIWFGIWLASMAAC